jgi:hypothetical protein
LLDAEVIKAIETALEKDKTVEVRCEKDKIIVFEITRKVNIKASKGC